MTELQEPLVVRRTVAFAEAVYEGEVEVEGSGFARMMSLRGALSCGVIPVLIDLRPPVAPNCPPYCRRHHGQGQLRDEDRPRAARDRAGPVSQPADCHVVIETNRGHSLGRAIYEGSAEPDTGEPGEVGGKTSARILRAPVTGVVESKVAIGERVAEGQLVAKVGGHAVHAGTAGVLRGMVRSGTRISRSVKIGDVDPRAEPAHCAIISDKSLAIAGGCWKRCWLQESVIGRGRMTVAVPESVGSWQEQLGAHLYIAERSLATAIFLAVKLRKPLFVEGEAGVGKTEIAKVLAEVLQRPLIRLQCYEGLDVSSALYEWNYAEQILQIRIWEAAGQLTGDSRSDGSRHGIKDIFTPDFLLKRPLLQAVDQADGRAPVLLIDELDRADEEFKPTGALASSVTIPELGTIRAPEPPIAVIVVLQEIHDALKRPPITGLTASLEKGTASYRRACPAPELLHSRSSASRLAQHRPVQTPRHRDH
jgi:hypothetical protein